MLADGIWLGCIVELSGFQSELFNSPIFVNFSQSEQRHFGDYLL